MNAAQLAALQAAIVALSSIAGAPAVAVQVPEPIPEIEDTTPVTTSQLAALATAIKQHAHPRAGHEAEFNAAMTRAGAK